MIVKIAGQVLVADIVTHEKGSHRVIQLLQMGGDKGAELVKLKDKELNNSYKIGARYEFTCNVQSWDMNGRSGIACSIISSSLLSGKEKEIDAPFNKAA